MTSYPLPSQDYAARFVLDTLPVHGRLVRLDETLNAILDAHAYPDAIATLLGEACVLAVMVGSALKFEGRLIMQAQGQGVVRYVVADYDTRGSLRGFCRFDPEELKALEAENAGKFQSLGAQQLLGQGTFIMTLEPDGMGDRYQGVTPIEGDSLSLCAEHYFAQSEQIPTQIKLAVSRETTPNGERWRAAGAMIQALAGDDSRGDTREAFEHVRALFATLGEEELTDFELEADRLLYRLFHEDGVRLSPPKPIAKLCRCSQTRVEELVRSFSADEQSDMLEPDGQVHITCEYCSKTFFVAP
ncbi:MULTISPECIES: Hsp33 family molecular chaperone HslO [Asticcacaulis]|jgi:molecular chaperone Hsp33|uniref:Chaperone protein Hsp33 n=1 Tax=Asticcacaulis excentricus TaxID=78587 RepID=A0A3G9G3X4_9CAUL|nr:MULTISPECIES: Hsp33 family molecular chaperone HslO [Asticcacaulis]MCA1935108.1 Hsp33 family molecular chaperone HslO [Asticcacaulis sp.]BBF81447.1 chaperone protein Hsp33 [Asticcacaulis excentricus]